MTAEGRAETGSPPFGVSGRDDQPLYICPKSPEVPGIQGNEGCRTRLKGRFGEQGVIDGAALQGQVPASLGGAEVMGWGQRKDGPALLEGGQKANSLYRWQANLRADRDNRVTLREAVSTKCGVLCPCKLLGGPPELLMG